MPFDWQSHLREMAAHLVMLRLNHGFREHARHRLAELEKNALYGPAFTEMVNAEWKRIREASNGTNEPRKGRSG